jgi:ParB-like chromosome segregation protein Spo0J
MDRKTEGQEIGTTQKNSSKTRIELGIVYRRIDDLKPDPANPRCHTRKQVRQIAESIKAFGFNVPILIDRYGNIIAGHGRWLAGREFGITEVPTLCLDHLTPAQARAFMIADNRLAEIAIWDDRLLAQQFKDLSVLGLDFSIEVTGFEMARSICGSHHSTTRPRPKPTRQMLCPRFRRPRSAS